MLGMQEDTTRWDNHLMADAAELASPDGERDLHQQQQQQLIQAQQIQLSFQESKPQ